MYLRFDTRLAFPALAKALCPQLTEDTIDWDYENVYEWMYVDLPQLDFSLNVSRAHGWADIEDEVLDQYQDNREQLEQIVQPGPVYVFGWDRGKSDYVDNLPISCHRLSRIGFRLTCLFSDAESTLTYPMGNRSPWSARNKKPAANIPLDRSRGPRGF